MQSIDDAALQQLEQKFEAVMKKFPPERRALHERIGDIARAEVTGNIAGSGMKSTGTVEDWQQKYVGSGGGYAAVRAIKGSGSNGPGAITNYLENGHKIRAPSGAAKRYKPRVNTAYVNGYHFYAAAKSGELEGKVRDEIAKTVQNLAKELE
ncbi:MAG: hypothetical protein E7572_09540 [Ruminococcaceae bacterium]|nr:hypothetical protein [Oscillospiraceae bacterium]